LAKSGEFSAETAWNIPLTLGWVARNIRRAVCPACCPGCYSSVSEVEIAPLEKPDHEP
jgi:hypothetical protein